MKIDNPALTVVREYLDLMMYSMVDLRLSLELGPSLIGFPDFEALRRISTRLDPEQQVLFRLLRLGETVDDQTFRKSVPDTFAAALLATELAVREPDGSWRTSGLLVVPAEGLLLITGIPSAYPTATGFSQAWFDLSAFIVAKTLPRTVTGRVLDICSGTGVQSLLCAGRGATEVVGLELQDSAVAIAQANAVLNGLSDRVEFRQSDVLSALRPDEQFDFVVCNLPYAPIIPTDECPSTVAEIGNSVLWPVLAALPPHLSESAQGIVATWRSIGYRRSTDQLSAISSRLTAEGCAVTAYLDPAFDTIENVLRLLRKDLSRRPGVAPDTVESLVHQVKELIETSAAPMDGFYNQLVHFTKAPAAPSTTVYGLALPQREE